MHMGSMYYHFWRHVGIHFKHRPWHKQIKKQTNIINRTLDAQLIALTSFILPLTGSRNNLSTISALEQNIFNNSEL